MISDWIHPERLTERLSAHHSASSSGSAACAGGGAGGAACTPRDEISRISTAFSSLNCSSSSVQQSTRQQHARGKSRKPVSDQSLAGEPTAEMGMCTTHCQLCPQATNQIIQHTPNSTGVTQGQAVGLFAHLKSKRTLSTPPHCACKCHKLPPHHLRQLHPVMATTPHCTTRLPLSVWNSSRYLSSLSRLFVKMSMMGCGLLGLATNTCAQSGQGRTGGSRQCAMRRVRWKR